MVDNIIDIAEKFESFAARRPKGTTMSSKKMRKTWQKHKEEYHSYRKELAELEQQQQALDERVEDMRKKLFDARSGMLDMSRAIDKLDLAGASHSVFYDSGDVAFIVDKEEYHIDVKDGGEYDMIGMKEHLKNKKKEDKASADDAADDDGDDDCEEPEEEEEDMHDVVDTNAADDFDFDKWLQEFQALEI